MVALTASLVASGDPAPVQLVLTDAPAGASYTVTGSALGTSWPVPGGSGTAPGGQIVLVDNRSAVNVPVVYSAVVAGVTYAAAPVTVTYAGEYLLQSLDGQQVVEFTWQDNGLPRRPVLRSHVSDVPGRSRPPVRFARGGVGGGTWSIRTDPANTAALEALLLTGRPLVVRTDGAVRDLPAVDLFLPVDADNALWGAINDRDGRVWSLSYLLVDDPEPSTALAAFTWDDFDEAMATRTWADFDAIFAGSTWDSSFDVYDWGQL